MRMADIEKKLVGKVVTITTKDSWAFGEWGVIKMFDGEYFHIAIANGNPCLIFSKDEFRVERG